MTSVVVTGRGVVSSIAEDADAFFDALVQRRSGIADGLGSCADFDPEKYLTPKEARRADRFTQFAVAAAEQAIREAGLPEAAATTNCVKRSARRASLGVRYFSGSK